MLARTSLLVALALASCSTPRRGDPPPEAEAPPTDAMRFGWPVGARFEVVHTSARAGDTLELRARGSVEAHDADALEVSFEPPVVADRDKKRVAPKGSHAYMDLWPPLVVRRDTGELVGFGESIPEPAQDVVAFRWRVWTTLVGFDLGLGQKRTLQGEVEVGEGLLVPVRITEAHEDGGATGHRVVITRVYEGEPTKKLWVMMQADAGRPKPALEAIREATQEEKVVLEVEPDTLLPRLVDIQSTFTVTTLSGRTEKTDVHQQHDTWTFIWTK